MNSLCNQTYPSSNHQIIIVDGNSTDGTPEIVKEYIENLKEEFVRDYVFPMFRCNTIYEGEYLLGTSIARPLIAK